MKRRPTRYTRTDTLFPDATLVRSSLFEPRVDRGGRGRRADVRDRFGRGDDDVVRYHVELSRRVGAVYEPHAPLTQNDLERVARDEIERVRVGEPRQFDIADHAHLARCGSSARHWHQGWSSTRRRSW